MTPADSTFDPNAFLTTSVTGELDTKIIPVPEGDFPGQAESVVGRKAARNDGTGDAYMLDINWVFLSEEVKKATARDKPMAKQTIFLDMTDKGAIDMSKGKNVQLGALRDALGQNTSKPWAPNMLIGGRALCRVKHSPDKNDPDIKYANVTKVTKLK